MQITTNSADLDIPLIHRFLSESSYWAKGIPLAVVQRSIENSLCFGGFVDSKQMAFARVISDYATFAYLADVFVLPEFRGAGYSKRLLAEIVAHPQLQRLRRFALATSDAHNLYAQFGFKPLARPDTFMELYVPDVYR